MSTQRKRLAAITAAGVIFAIGAGGVAAAAWQGTGTGNAFASATALPTGPTPSAPATGTQTSTSISVAWSKVQYTGTSADVAGYVITRYKAGVADTIGGNCTGTLSATTTTCTDTVGGAGTYQYSVTPTSGNWTGTEGTKSGTVTVNTANPATGLQIANCSSGSVAIGRNGNFTITINTINSSGTITNTTQQANVSLSTSGSGVRTGPTPTSLTVNAGSSSSSSTSSVGGADNNGWSSFTLKATASGFTDATCTLSRT